MIARLLLVGALIATAPVSVAAQGAAMAPFKVVRSLQLVQDRLARGDHAALPMQRKLLELTDERFRAVTRKELEDRRNFTALMVYAMSGGNPATLDVVLSRTMPAGNDRALGLGVLAYMRGQLPRAAQALADIDPMTLEPEVGAYLALVKGSIIALSQPGTALGFMDQARLLAPGTLVEEAALRRSLPACITLNQPERFMTVAEQYTRRFLRSPYASEFADAFVEGLVAFHDRIGAQKIDRIVSLMRPAQQEAIYLRLARRSTIKGQAERSAFASTKAREVARQTDEPEDPRAVLYAALASITSENAQDVVATLEKVDPAMLSPRDRRLFQAARAIAAEMLSPPAPPAPETETAALETQDKAEAGAPAVAPRAEKTAEPLPTTANEPEIPAIDTAAAPDTDDETYRRGSELVTSVREKLDAIDRMLEEEEEVERP
ncbi:chemotaxis protein MotC [Nitratireductor sp. CAU 1489]|uniref:Chemotaxis protein MotC n=1 Tax=Nitratireductor arenosus TaxID=2682096 RepID=A0A844QCG8_9HYPH|nr:chemotaxis protein MotC [Nitratireductor arenosus]MVA95710.1 chemotaxis protein MotC [Nitratireductor arenosus]